MSFDTYEQTITFNVNDTSNATVTVLTNNSAQDLFIRKIGFSILTADNITFVNNGTTVWGPIYTGATGGFTEDLDRYPWKLLPGKSLTVTKQTAGTNMTVFGEYAYGVYLT